MSSRVLQQFNEDKTQKDWIERAIEAQDYIAKMGGLVSLGVQKAASEARKQIIRELKKAHPNKKEDEPWPDSVKSRILKRIETDWKEVERARSNGIVGVIRKAVEKGNLEAAEMTKSAPLEATIAAEFIGNFNLFLKTVDARDYARVKGILQTGLIKGDSYFRIASHLKKEVGITAYESKRIARTEMSRAFHNQKMILYKERGVTKVKHYNPRACKLCDPYHNKVFYLGDNPSIPLHPHCRCVTVPINDHVKVTKVTEQGLEKRIRELENGIRARRTEKVICLDRKGNFLFQQVGSKNKITIRDEYLKYLKNSIITHNHPNSSGFSKDDIKCVLEHKIEEIRITSKLYNYQLALNWSQIESEKVFFELYDLMEKEIISISNSLLEKEMLSMEEVELYFDHHIIKKVKDKMPSWFKKYQRENNGTT